MGELGRRDDWVETRYGDGVVTGEPPECAEVRIGDFCWVVGWLGRDGLKGNGADHASGVQNNCMGSLGCQGKQGESAANWEE